MIITRKRQCVRHTLLRESCRSQAVEEFIDGLDVKMRAKVFGRLELLEEYGSQIGMPFSRHLEDGIFELRLAQGGNTVRILYFFAVGRTIVLTHGFVKKTRRTACSGDRTGKAVARRLEAAP